MSALGHEQTSRNVRVMPVIPLEADIRQRGLHVRLVPDADIPRPRRSIDDHRWRSEADVWANIRQ